MSTRSNLSWGGEFVEFTEPESSVPVSSAASLSFVPNWHTSAQRELGYSNNISSDEPLSLGPHLANLDWSDFLTTFSNYLLVFSLPQTRVIFEFAGEPYEVKEPITVEFHRRDPGIEARFEEANIAWVDDSWIEAYNGVKTEILNTFEDYEENKSILGPEPQRQLSVLRRHIRRNSSA